jgi:hypothetical protein
MNRTTLRTGLAFTAAVAALYAGTAALPTADAADAAPRSAALTTTRTTTLTFTVPDCDGCTLQLGQGLWDDSAKSGVRFWESKEKTVRDGEATFTVPARRTHGMSVLVRAPWEGHTGYVTTVAFHYGGFEVGEDVSFTEARHQRKASACWEGTRRDAVTIPLTVRKVRVEGVRHEVNGSIAYVDTTQSWLDPMRRVWRGVMGSQDLNVCGPA